MNIPPPIPPPPVIPPANHPIASITYELTRGDLFVNSLTVVCRNRLVQLMILGALLFNGWVTVGAKWGQAPAVELWLQAVGLAIVLIVIVAGSQLVLGLLMAYVLKQKGVVGEHTLEVTEAGLVERTAFNESLHKWPGVCRIVSQFGYIYIYVGDHNSHQVPRRCFPLGQLDGFMTQLRARALHIKS